MVSFHIFTSNNLFEKLITHKNSSLTDRNQARFDTEIGDDKNKVSLELSLATESQNHAQNKIANDTNDRNDSFLPSKEEEGANDNDIFWQRFEE